MLAKEIVVLGTQGEEVAVPFESKVTREIGEDGRPADVAMGGAVSLNAPLEVDVLLRSDGSWAHWRTAWDGRGNPYMHLRHGEGAKAPTEAQLRTVARWWLGLEPRPYGIAIGNTVYQWAFGTMTPQEVSDRYGDGGRVYLNG